MTKTEVHSAVKRVLQQAGMQPRHRFGQNFMIEPASLQAMISTAQIAADDRILEVGPGPGNLTHLIAERAGHVLAVDIDRQLLPAAKASLSAHTNITWLCADALDGKHRLSPHVHAALINLAEGRGVKLVANLPYNIASPLMVILLSLAWRYHRGMDGGVHFKRLTFTVQLEVARRMTAQPDTSAYGALTVMIAAMAQAQVIRTIPAGHFWPPPQIDSALVDVIPQPERADAIDDFGSLEEFVSQMFSHRRQTIRNALRHSFSVSHTPLDLRMDGGQPWLEKRPGELPPTEFIALANRLRPPDRE
jgi:16S rRNA (adenine1518-N6/adenine1519-N6)-dimethyltransferase